MSNGNHRDNPETRDAQAKVAREFREAARQRGNSTMTQGEALRRVQGACRRGDQIRDNGNR